MDVTWVETAVAAVLDMKVCLPLSHLILDPLLIRALKLIRWDVCPGQYTEFRLQHLSASYFIFCFMCNCNSNHKVNFAHWPAVSFQTNYLNWVCNTWARNHFRVCVKVWIWLVCYFDTELVSSGLWLVDYWCIYKFMITMLREGSPYLWHEDMCRE
jgi:hypothetical protein